MPRKIPVGVLGASGYVGQQYLRLLENHPTFEVVFQAARKPPYDTVYDRKKAQQCALVFSALPSSIAQIVEPLYAEMGLPVFSSASYHRLESDIPLIIPEINGGHLAMLDMQKKNRGWDRGFIVAKPNCTLQSYLLPLYPLHQHFRLTSLSVTNLQAVSGAGAGYKLDQNIIPYIPEEEEKSEVEPLKILADWNGKELLMPSMTISTHCIRVPVEHGHLACISASFEEKPTLEEVLEVWKAFKGLDLPSAPPSPLVYFEEKDRPQPKLDALIGRGMAVALGRLRSCPIFDLRFIALSHNLIRGAAGGGLLTAELYYKEYR